VLLECVHVPSPADDASYAKAFAALEQVVAESKDQIAAVVLEPLLQGTAGMRTYDAEYLRRARALCDAHGVLLVFDEVFTGYGRTGPMWASDRAGVRPDLMCIAKGFTGGMLPMAATLVTDRVFDAFLGPPERAFYYGHSYCGNPLGAAIAREVLAIYREELVLERAAPKAARIAAAFARFAALPGVARTRSLGMTAALDLDAAGGYLGRAGWRVYDEARRRGAYLRPLGDTIYVAPPINIADADLDELLAIVEESVRVGVANAENRHY
jgi:adenosylmethionine-8-amino-7-oxononanoate aminotransferase